MDQRESDFRRLLRLVERDRLLARISGAAVPGIVRRIDWWLTRLRAFLRARYPSGDPGWPLGMALLYLNCPDQELDSDEIAFARDCLLDVFVGEGSARSPAASVPWGILAYQAMRIGDLTADPRFIRMADAYWERIRLVPRASDGCLPYRRGRDELLVDSVGLIVPFLVRYGVRNPASMALDLAKRQLDGFLDSAIDAASGLPFHGYFSGSGSRIGIVGWGRGVGWLLIGLVDAAHELPEGDSYRESLIEEALALLVRLKGLQRSSGHWGWQVLVPDSKDDSSATAMIGYATARLQQLCRLTDPINQMLSNAVRGISAVTDPGTGWVGNSSGECEGVGEYSDAFVCNTWVQGPAFALKRIGAAGG